MGSDGKGTKFQRTFFYSQPSKTGKLGAIGYIKNSRSTNWIADSVPQCVHGTRNSYGECSCDTRYTGDYCNDRVRCALHLLWKRQLQLSEPWKLGLLFQICLNGGTASLGTCVCVNGFYGDFCENGECPNIFYIQQIPAKWIYSHLTIS